MEINELQRNETKARDRVRALKGKFPALAYDPVLNAEAMRALQAEIAEAEQAHLQTRIAVKRAELVELENLQ